ncbi:MAG: magnesium transporter [Armatimonadetes bacterium]|nr:magnesium transporter [Armatimonadota bacterium]
MAATTQENLAQTLRNALRHPPGEGGALAMTAALRAKHPADIADAMQELERAEALAIFNWLDNARAADTLVEIDPELVRYILDNAPPIRISDLLDRMPMDDAAEVISEADPDTAEELLAELSVRSPEDAADVRELLSYEEGTAGRLMSDKYIRLAPDMTTDEALVEVRSADPEIETLSALYVVAPNHNGAPGEDRLIGVLPLRALLRAKPYKKVANLMDRNLITVSVDTDQEEVARTIAKYDFVAVPVLDHRGMMAGIVTVDDVLDVLQEEQTEDVLKLGAVAASEYSYAHTGVLATVKQRFGWLLLLFVAETATGTVLRHFQDELARVVALSFFVPLLIGTGGNAGAQTVTTITRALALGEVEFRDLMRVVMREASTGVLLGSALGAVGFARALVWKTGPDLAFVVGISMVVIVLWAVTVGSVLPILFKRIGWDPAVMSAPFITTLVDATGLFFYFTIAKPLLRL